MELYCSELCILCWSMWRVWNCIVLCLLCRNMRRVWNCIVVCLLCRNMRRVWNCIVVCLLCRNMRRVWNFWPLTTGLRNVFFDFLTYWLNNEDFWRLLLWKITEIIKINIVRCRFHSCVIDSLISRFE